MNNPEILEQIKSLNLLISNALEEAGKGQDISFFKSLVQKNAIDIYQKASLLTETSFQKPVPSAPATPEIKIIRQDEIIQRELPAEVKKEQPVEMQKPVVKEVKEEIIAPPQEEVVPPVQKTEIAEKKPVEIHTPPAAPKTRITPELSEEKESLNDKLSKNKQPVLNVAEKSKETPIKDLVKFISIGKKFEFINGLFDGNSDIYKSTLQNIEHASSYQEASNFLEANITDPYEWDTNEELAAEFFGLVKRRFL